MATLKLSDGRSIPVVKPNIADQMLLERQMRATNKKYGPADFAADLKLGSFQQAFAIFASFNRVGEKPNIQEILELNFDDLEALVTLEPGDSPDDDDDEDAEPGSEGGQTPDPQPAQTGDGAPAE